jgi:hypothetical protein
LPALYALSSTFHSFTFILPLFILPLSLSTFASYVT